MTEFWTDKWIGKVGEKPCFYGEWALMLSQLTDDQLARGLMLEKISSKGWPSEIPEFYNNCVNIPLQLVEDITIICMYWNSDSHLKSRGLSKTKEAYYVINNCDYLELQSSRFERATKIVEKALDAMIKAINNGYVLPDLPDSNIARVECRRAKASFADALNAMKYPVDKKYTLRDLRELRSMEVSV